MRTAALLGAICASLCIAGCVLASSDTAPATAAPGASWIEKKVDVVIRDKRGRIAAASKDDLQIHSNGTPLRVTSLDPASPASKGSLRLVTLVMNGGDDLARHGVVEALDEIAKDPLGSNTYVAIWRVWGRLSLLQNFTNNLETAKDALSPGVRARDSGSRATPSMSKPAEFHLSSAAAPGGSCVSEASTAENALESACAMAQQIEQIQAELTSQRHWRPVTALLVAISRAQRNFKGRKTVLLFSDPVEFNATSDEALTHVVSEANRSKVSIYCVDLSGITRRAAEEATRDLLTMNSINNDALAAASAASARGIVGMAGPAERRNFSGQTELRKVALQTAGLYSDTMGAVRKLTKSALEDSESYYELAYEAPVYEPDEQFQTLDVHSNRRSLRLQTRAGSFPSIEVARKEVSGFEIPLVQALRKAAREETIWFSGNAFVSPSDNDHSRVKVSLNIPLSGFVAHELDESKRFTFRFSVLALVRQHDGQIVDKASKDVALEGALENLLAARKQSYTIAFPLSAFSDTCSADVAVRDEFAGKISTKTFECSRSVAPDVTREPAARAFVDSNSGDVDEPELLGSFAVEPALDRSKPPSNAATERLIAGARARVSEYKRTLPNFVCISVRRRFIDAAGRGAWKALDVSSFLLAYVGGQERRLALDTTRLSGGPASLVSDEGANVEGEFGELLEMPFDEKAQARVAWEGTAQLMGNTVQVFRFSVNRVHSRYTFERNSRDDIATAYHALMYIDVNTFGVRRISIIADDVPAKSFIRECRLTVDYDYVPISGNEFLLPVHASLLVHRRGRTLNRTEIDFQNYRRYGSESKFVADP